MIDYGSSAPHHSLNFLGSYKFPDSWQLSLGYYFQSSMTYLRSQRIKPYQRLDVVLQKTLRLAENQLLNFAVVHQNILGSKDEFLPGNRLSDQTLVEVSYQYY